jgi:AcrR family transcriptional regulator
MGDVAAAGPGAIPAPAAGLRERKKARTRAAIREHALRLFREQGYAVTTVEQIAAAAEVSPATFFRYFPTKEDVVLQDDFDVVTIGALQAQPPELSPVAAFRAAAAATLAAMTDDDKEQFRQTSQLTAEVPEIRARAIDEFTRTIDGIGAALAARSGREPGDFAVRTLAGAIIGVIMSATMPALLGEEVDVDETFGRIDAALAQLEAGLPV